MFYFFISNQYKTYTHT